MCESVNSKDPAELLLQGGSLGWDVLGPQAAPSRFGLGWIEVEDLSYFKKLFIQRRYRKTDPCVGGFALKKGREHQSQDTVEGVHTQFLVGPVERRGKADPMGIFHLLERILNMVLCPTAKDDFFRAPFVIVGAQNALAESGTLESFKCGGIRAEEKIQPSIGLDDFCFENLGNILS